ncbi:MAG TPA: glutathione peroxidase [Flavisolibacter sp.]|nr:glutathione peroxidase [Flavisolibacter sp.]
MKTLIIASLLSLMLTGNSFYDFKVQGLDGKEINLAKFKGKKVLVVNTASECGYTPQYADLQKLADTYKNKLVVIGFPANNFGGQEPGSNDQIGAFCKKNYGVTFPMAAKVSVTGDDAAPLFKYLTEEAKKLGTPDPVIKWNFTKFLIDEKGKLVKVFPSKVKPMSEEITVHLN